MLMPKRVKHRKQFRGSMAGKALRGNKISNGEYGIVALEPACNVRDFRRSRRCSKRSVTSCNS